MQSPTEKDKLLSAVDNVEDNDEFLGYGCSGNGCGEIFYLQFRDGKLINYIREDFKPNQPAQISSVSPAKQK